MEGIDAVVVSQMPVETGVEADVSHSY